MIETHAVSRMLHGGMLNRSHIISLIGIIRPCEIGFGICWIHDTDGHLSWRWGGWKTAAAAAAARRVGIVCVWHLGLFGLVVAPDLAEIGIDEVDAPAGFFPDLVEDGEDFVLFGSRGETCGDGVEGAESDARDTSIFDVSYDSAKLSCVV